MLLKFWYNLAFILKLYYILKKIFMIITNKSFFNKLPTEAGCIWFIFISDVLQIAKGNLIKQLKKMSCDATV